MSAKNATLCLIIFISLCSRTRVSAYKNYSLSNPNLCSEISKHTIKLETHAKSGLLVNEGHSRDHRIAWTHNQVCKFKVKPDGFIPYYNRDIGIYAVILSMNLRTNHSNCIDYIQFKRKNGTTSKRYCGNLKAAQVLDPNRVFGEDKINEEMISFKDPEGELSAYIVIDKNPLGLYEETSLHIAFTAYTKCTASGGLKPCSALNNECIDKDYFNDGIINCPYMGCIDEGICKLALADTFPVNTIGSQVLIGSMTSLLISFGVFVCCVYTCRKYGKLCWSDDCSRPRNAANRPLPTQPRPTRAEATLEEALPTVTSSAPSEDKDLPPSYDSLFPENSHSATNAR